MQQKRDPLGPFFVASHPGYMSEGEDHTKPNEDWGTWAHFPCQAAPRTDPTSLPQSASHSRESTDSSSRKSRLGPCPLNMASFAAQTQGLASDHCACSFGDIKRDATRGIRRSSVSTKSMPWCRSPASQIATAAVDRCSDLWWEMLRGRTIPAASRNWGFPSWWVTHHPSDPISSVKAQATAWCSHSRPSDIPVHSRSGKWTSSLAKGHALPSSQRHRTTRGFFG